MAALVVALSAFFLIWWLNAMNKGVTVVTDGTTTLHIPRRYVQQRIMAWLDNIKTLDDDSRSALIEIPERELGNLKLPHLQRLGGVVTLLNETERSRLRYENAGAAEKIRSRLAANPRLVAIEPETVQGLYRVYDEGLNYSWTAVSAYPDQVIGSDVIGTCLALAGGEVKRCYIQLDLDGVGFRYYLNVGNLGDRDRLTKYFAQLFEQWKVGDPRRFQVTGGRPN